MAVWLPQNLGDNLSQIFVKDDAQDAAIRSHERGTTTPSTPVVGQFWARTDHPTYGEAIMYRTPSGFTVFADPDFAQLNAGGTIAMGANMPMGGFVLTGLGAGSANGHSVRYEQVLLRSGAQAMTGNLDLGGFTLTNVGADFSMASHKITNLAAPSSANDAARKADVDASGMVDGVATTSAGVASVSLGLAPATLILDIVGTNGVTDSARGIIFEGSASSDSRAIMFFRNNTGTLEHASRTISVTRSGTGFTVTVGTSGLGSQSTTHTIRYAVRKG